MNFSLSWVKWSSLLATSIGIIIGHQSAIAAGTIVLQYGIFQRSLSVYELTTFAETTRSSVE